MYVLISQLLLPLTVRSSSSIQNSLETSEPPHPISNTEPNHPLMNFIPVTCFTASFLSWLLAIGETQNITESFAFRLCSLFTITCPYKAACIIQYQTACRLCEQDPKVLELVWSSNLALIRKKQSTAFWQRPISPDLGEPILILAVSNLAANGHSS